MPSELAGLAAGDVMIAIDQLKVSHSNIEALLGRYRVDDLLTVHAFRRDELMSFELCLQAAPADRVELNLKEGADAESLQRRNSWLGILNNN